MKKYLIFSIVALSVSTLGAITGYKIAEASLRPTVSIYSFKGQSDNTVSTFDDKGNKCYIATGYNSPGGTNISISCVKQ